MGLMSSVLALGSPCDPSSSAILVTQGSATCSTLFLFLSGPRGSLRWFATLAEGGRCNCVLSVLDDPLGLKAGWGRGMG